MAQTKVVCILLLFFSSVYAQEKRTSIQSLVNQKQYAKAIQLSEEFTVADSTDFTSMYLLGQAYEGMLKHKEALSIYDICLGMDTLQMDVLNALARTSTNLGRVKQAEGYFLQILEKDSTDFHANYQLARLYSQSGAYSQAIDYFEYLLETDSLNTALLRNIGDCYSRMENLPGAFYYYDKAYANNKENAGLSGTLVNTIFRLGGNFLPLSLAVCDTALVYNPENYQVSKNKAMALYLNREYEQADSLYSSLMEKGDSTYFTMKYGGASRYYSGKYMNAIEPLEAAYQMDTTSVEVCLLLGSVLGKTYDRKRSYILLDQAEEGLKPSEFMVNQLLLFRAENYQRDGRITEAAKLHYEFWKNNPKRLDILWRITTYYGFSYEDARSEEEKQRGLFAYQLFVKESLANGLTDPKEFVVYRKYLMDCYENMFFRSVDDLPLLAPDGKRSKISKEELKELIDKISS